MTNEEKQQVQNLINAKTKLLTEKAARQEEQIKSLSDTIVALSSSIESRDREIDSLKNQLVQAQEQSQKLLALVRQDSPKTPSPKKIPEPPKKPNYLLSLLRQHFGHFGIENFRPGQEEIIDAILSGRDVFCSMPDGYGLSVCYRLPALLMPGLTLVITPDGMNEDAGNHGDVLTPSLQPSKRREILRKVRNGTCKILYSTLDELTQDDSLNALAKTEISMAAIISRWAVPNNLENWKEFSRSLSKKRITTGIFADETSPAMRSELLKLIGLQAPLKISTGFEKSVQVIKTEKKNSWLTEFLSRKNGASCVIYCSEPEKLKEDLKDFENVTIIKTSVYNKNDRDEIWFTIHYDIPENLGSFSKQAAKESVILISRADLKKADRSVASLCNSDVPKDFLLSYLGEDEKFSGLSVRPQESKPDIQPEDISDYDFSGADEAQKEAVISTEGPLLILAGPGTGKTFTLVQRVVFMIQKKHVAPENIMIATFTDKAAREIISRITTELSRRNILVDTGSMYAGTFHTICSRLLREYSRTRKNFRIVDDFDHAYAIMQNFKRFAEIPGLSDALKTRGKWPNSCELRDYINTLTEELADVDELIRDSDISVSSLGFAMKIHDDILNADNLMTYSSLLSETYKLLRDNPEILSELHERIKYVIVDEYQDTNYVQEQLAFILAGSSKNICVAGDDDQSIYRFRGAAVRNILEFSSRFSENECRIVKLIINYRSLPDIIKFSNEWMTGETSKFFSWENFRTPKKLEASRSSSAKNPSVLRLAGLHNRKEWQEKILHFIRSLKDAGKLTDYSQIAFLFRSVRTPDVQALMQFLEDNNVNVYSPRSKMFFQRGEVQFAIGCLISMFPEYMKSLNSGTFNFQGTKPDYVKYYKSCLSSVAKFIDRPQYSGLKKHILTRRTFHGRLTGFANYTYSDLLYELFAYFPFNHALNADINGTVKDLRPARNLARLVQIVRQYEYSYNINSLNGKYLATQFQMMMNIYLRFKIDDGLDEYEGGSESIPSGHAAFMTIHQAKGMEFPVVFADSLWSTPQKYVNPDRNAELMQNIAENYYRRPEFEPSESVKFFDFWRLYYVAFTRARDLLILTCNEDNNTPSEYFEASYDKLNDADESFTPSEIEITPSRNSGLKESYSFTADILTYEICTLQYKFFRELEFLPGRSTGLFTGTLIHAVLNDIHRAVINHEENKINEAQISEWFESEYEHLSRTEQSHLTKSARETAMSQIMRYVQRRGSDWSAIRRSEYEVNAVRGDYILEGVIDLLSIQDGEAEITDFKYGTKPNININVDRERLEAYRRQVFAYGWLLEHSSGLKVKRLKIYYTGENSGSPEIVFQYDSDEAEKVMKGFDETVKKIAGKDFSRKARDLETCKECVFRYYCGEN